MDGTRVEVLDAVTPLDLEKSDSLEDTTSSVTASRDLDQLVHPSVQEEAKSDNSSVQQETNNIEPSSCDLHENNSTQVTTIDNDNGALCDNTKFNCTSDETGQVVNVDRSDNLLAVDDTANGNMPSFSQEEQLCNLVKPVCVQNKLSVTEKILSPNSPSGDASPNSPIAALCRGQESPSPLKVERMSLSTRDLDESMPAVCSCVSQVKLVDYSYNGDSDNGDESINAIDNDAMDDGAMQVKKPVLDHNDSTDSISDESDSNSLVHKSGCTKFTASCETDSTELLHDSSDTGSESFIEEIDLVTNVNVKIPSLENIALSPPLMCTKTITQTSKYVPVSPILNEDVIPSIMDVKTSTENKVMVHMVEMPPLPTSTVSTVATPSVSTEVTPSVFNVPVPHISTSATSPVFNITEPVSPVSSSLPAATAVLNATTSTMSSAYSDNLPSVADKVTCLYNENLSSITSAIMFQDVSSSSKNSFVSNKETPVSSIGLHSLLASTTVNGNDGVISLNNLSPFVLPSQFEKASLPVLTAHDEVSVFASSESIPTTCPHSIPKLCTFDSVQSVSIPVTSQKFSSSKNDMLTISLTQASSQATPVEASHSSSESTVTIAPDYSSNGDGNQSTEPTQPTGSCQVDQQESPVPENSDDGPVATFPAALKLSIDLSVLPHKKKVLQRAKWTTLLTTPVPVLRERKRPLKPTVIVKSTVIKSNRKSTVKSSPKKQLPLSIAGSQYEIGDVLWSKFSYWDPWPCKIILHSKVSQPEPTPDQVNNSITVCAL